MSDAILSLSLRFVGSDGGGRGEAYYGRGEKGEGACVARAAAIARSRRSSGGGWKQEL